jgi:hypothetical protein
MFSYSEDNSQKRKQYLWRDIKLLSNAAYSGCWFHGFVPGRQRIRQDNDKYSEFLEDQVLNNVQQGVNKNLSYFKVVIANRTYDVPVNRNHISVCVVQYILSKGYPIWMPTEVRASTKSIVVSCLVEKMSSLCFEAGHDHFISTSLYIGLTLCYVNRR